MLDVVQQSLTYIIWCDSRSHHGFTLLNFFIDGYECWAWLLHAPNRRDFYAWVADEGLFGADGALHEVPFPLMR